MLERRQLHTHEHHVGLALVGSQAIKGFEGRKEAIALLHHQSGLGLELLLVIKGKGGASGVQNAHVVGRSHLVDLLHPWGLSDHVTQSRTRQSEFGQGSHQNHLGVGLRICAHLSEPSLPRKRGIRLIHDHHPCVGAHSRDDPLDGLRAPKVRCGVVRVSQINNSGLVQLDGFKHLGLIEFKVITKRHANVGQTHQL